MRLRSTAAAAPFTAMEPPPADIAAVDPALVLLRDPGHPVADAIRGIRTRLAESWTGSPADAQVVALLGADEFCETSPIAANLAAALALGGQSTLLVDAKIDAPSLHLLFGVPLDPGLTELLAGAARPDAAIHRTLIASLALLPAGAARGDDVERLEREPLPRRLRGEIGHARTVVVDVGGARGRERHGRALGADAVVLVARRHISRQRDIDAAAAELAEAGTPILGAMLTG
jgi:tyrosine-protein kinase Etk/Wzc